MFNVRDSAQRHRAMLNIKDIMQRAHYEPPEVIAIRDNILNSFKNLEFQEGPHKYYLHKQDGSVVELPSVSAVTHQFQPYVDWDEKAAQYALKHDMTKEAVQRMWEENNVIATNNGTQTHLFGEAYMHFFMGHPENMPDLIKPQYEKGYLIPYGAKQEAVCRFYEDLFTNNRIYPVMPEAKVYMGLNDRYAGVKPYAGTFDMLFAYKASNGIWKLLVYDWKGLPLDTPILTKEGFKTMGTLDIGDIVYDKDGHETKILHISKIHNNPCVKIKFSDGYSIVCDTDHKWLVSSNKWKTDKAMTAAELKKYIDDLGDKSKNGYYAVRININKPIENTTTSELPVDPYVLGVWLGDGHSKAGYVTNMYDEIFDEISRRGYRVGKNVNDGVHCGKAKTRCVFGLYPKLKTLGILGDKNIPAIYLTHSTYKERLDLLRGLMDTDGYYNKTRNRFVLSTTRLKQAQFTAELIASLGIKPTTLNANGKCNNCKRKKIFEKFDVCFSTDINPFLVRNISRREHVKRYDNSRIITSVEQCNTVPTRCIEVDSPTHTYLAGRELLVTHNTNKTLENDYARNFGITATGEFSDMVDEPMTYYTLQLNAYSMCLEQLGYEVADRKVIWLEEDSNYEKISVPDISHRLASALAIR